MSEFFKSNERQSAELARRLTEAEKQRLNTFIEFSEGLPLRIGVRGSESFLEEVLQFFRSKSFNIVKTGVAKNNNFTIPDKVGKSGYVVVVESTGDWDNHSMNKEVKSLTLNQLGISDTQNAVFISWTRDNRETSGGGSEFDLSFMEKM